MRAEEINRFQTIHRETVKVAQDLATQEFQLIEYLQRIDRDKIYRFFGFKSLSQYAILALKLSDDRAFNLILVARKAAQIEKLQLALKEGKITLSKAKRISSVLSPENADKWLKTASSVSQRNLEQLVAKVNPKAGVQEGTHFISETMLEFKAVISVETEQMFKRAQDLLCQSRGKAVSFDETLKVALQTLLEKKDPVLKAERAIKRKLKRDAAKKASSNADTEEKQNGESVGDTFLISSKIAGAKASPKSHVLRRAKGPLPTEIKHEIALRFKGRCQEKNPDGSVCGDGRWTDHHHIKQVSDGGLDIIENLVTLCRAHHQMHHARF